jgi:outer membrane receptor protein involved in Fe transport
VRNEYFDVAPTRGNLTFNGSFTNNAFADFLLGYSQRAQLTNVYVVNQRLWSTSFFVQDDWKATDALTVNLGLRYDFTTPPYDANNQMANFDPTGAGSLYFASDGSLADRALVEPDKNNFSPRVGLVYKLGDRTILRGGYGTFYNQFERAGSEDQLALNPPGLRNIDITATGNTNPVLFLRDGFPSDFLDRLVIGNLMLRAADPKAPRTRVQQFGGGVERQLGPSFVVSADVIGSVTDNLAVLRNINQPLPGTLDANGPRPYPAFGSNVQWREMTGSANYKGMDLGFEKRFTNGYSYRASYTLSETRDNAPEHLADNGGDRPQNGRDLDAWEGASNFDIRHRFVGNFIAELPFGEGKPMLQSGVGKAILGNWLASGIFSARTGRPFTVTQGTNNVGPGATGVPNLTGEPEGPQTVEQWYNVAAFTRVPSGVFGDSPRNVLRGPGWVTFDLSLQRRLDFTSRVNATLRWDIFNVFDRANLGLPERNIAAATAGVISSLAGDPRVMQLSVRVAF